MSITIPHWSGLELDVMRIGLGFVVVFAFAKIHVLRPSGRPEYPVGIARVVDLERFSSRAAVRRMQLVAYAAAVFYVGDVLVPFALAVLTILVIVDVTLRSSYGAVNHGSHLLAIVLAAQTAAVLLWNAAEQWSWNLGAVVGSSQASTAAWWSIEAIVAAYFTSGVAKLVATRGQWIQRSPGLLLSAQARTDIDSLMGDSSWGASGKSAAAVGWLLARPTIARTMFAGGLLVELCAPIGLLGKTVLCLVGLALLALHQANGRLLGLPFVEYQLLVLVFLVNVPQIFR